MKEKIKYRLYRCNNPANAGYGKVYARIESGKTVGLRELAVRLARRNKLVTEATAMLVLMTAVDEISDLLAEGKKVKIDDLCILYLTMLSAGAESEEAFSPKRHILRLMMGSRATGRMRDVMEKTLHP